MQASDWGKARPRAHDGPGVTFSSGFSGQDTRDGDCLSAALVPSICSAPHGGFRSRAQDSAETIAPSLKGRAQLSAHDAR